MEDDTYIVKGLPSLQPILNASIGELIYNKLIANCSKEEALIDAFTKQSITFKDLLGKICTLAESLKKSSFKEDTVIAISSENCIEYPIPVIATLYIGAIVTPINHNYTSTELLHVLNISQPEIIFCSKQTYPKFIKLQSQLEFIRKVLIINDRTHSESMESFWEKHLCRYDLLYIYHLTKLDIDQQLAFILYSSGTTGLPKGVMITHKNVLVALQHSDDPRIVSGGKEYILGLLPFFHAFGLFVLLTSIYKQSKVVVLQKFEEKLFLNCIEQFKISRLPLVPPLAVFLAKSPLVEKYNLSSVKYIGSGAASLSKEIEEALKKRLKVNSFRQAYGLTEATLGVTGSLLNNNKRGSVGKVYPHLLCKIRDPATGKSLGPNQIGEICVKGPSVMKGYYRNEEATKNAFTKDGWFLTGDLGYYDQEEYFYITGRIKELIKYKGFQVAPAELEGILLTHPKIKDVAVIGIPNAEAGELPLAFVVKHLNSDLTEGDVKKFIEEKVSPYKKLRGGVLFINEIPRNSSGKILRRVLQEMYDKNFKAKL